jgi:hypothetical protein
MHEANAHPRKQFFLEMFTRDIALEDCVLDLIDNSIDALSRARHLDYSPALLNKVRASSSGLKSLPHIDISYSQHEFKIIDNCGGIERSDALKEMFSFGHSRTYKRGQLGVYGIGLKRALFKIGRYFEIESKTRNGGFKVELDVERWSEKDDKPEDWTIPLSFTSGSSSNVASGTSITIKNLTEEVKMRLQDPTLAKALHSAIGTTYSLFLDRVVRLKVNKDKVDPLDIPIGESQKVTPAHKDFEVSVGKGKVAVKLIASLAARGTRDEWSSERAGWYVFCNNRVVVAADRTDLTGWNLSLPKFHSKYSGFVGLAFFQSSDPALLPWTTTKRGVNKDSLAYQRARSQMAIVARPILSFLNEMYPSDLPEDLQQRTIAETVKQSKLAAFSDKPSSAFKVSRGPAKRSRSAVRVQFDATKSELERIKKQIRKSSWGAGRVGRFTFDHYLETECEE